MTESVVGQLMGKTRLDDLDDANIQEVFATARREVIKVPDDMDDNIQAIFQAAQKQNLKLTPTKQRMDLKPFKQPVAPAWSQPELEMVQRGCTGHLNPDPLGLKAEVAEQQCDRPRDRCHSSGKRHSGLLPKDW